MSESETYFRWDECREITKVSKDTDGYHVLRENIYSFLPNKYNNKNIVPKVGDRCSVACINYSEIVGFKINNEIVYLLTKEDIQKKHEREHEEYVEESKKEYEEFLKHYNEYLKEIHPVHLKEAKENHKKALNGDEYLISMEPYLLFIMREANKFYKYIKDEDTLNKFINMSYEEQKKVIPDMDDGHSGNTFNMACIGCRKIIQYENKNKINELPKDFYENLWYRMFTSYPIKSIKEVISETIINYSISSITKFTLTEEDVYKEIEKNTDEDIIDNLNKTYNEYKLISDKLNSLLFKYISENKSISNYSDIIYYQGLIMGLIISYKHMCFAMYKQYKKEENQND